VSCAGHSVDASVPRKACKLSVVLPVLSLALRTLPLAFAYATWAWVAGLVSATRNRLSTAG
jgi:multidrug transporter EmrE-like cation transporter